MPKITARAMVAPLDRPLWLFAPECEFVGTVIAPVVLEVAATPAMVIVRSVLEVKAFVVPAARTTVEANPTAVASNTTSTSLYLGLFGAVPTRVRLFGYHVSHCEASVGLTVAFTVRVWFFKYGARLKEKDCDGSAVAFGIENVVKKDGRMSMLSQVVRARVSLVLAGVMVRGSVTGVTVPFRNWSGVVPVKVFVELRILAIGKEQNVPVKRQPWQCRVVDIAYHLIRLDRLST